MKTKEISVPATVNEFTIEHTFGLIELSKHEENYIPTMLNKCKHVSLYSGTPIEEIKQMDIFDVNKVFEHCVNELSKYKQKKPLKEIELNGQKYCLIDLEKQTAGWLLDYEAKTETFESHPEKWCAMCYIEKGKKYGDVKTSEREEIFRVHFPATLMFDLSGFFLRKFWNYTNATVSYQKKILKKEQRKAKKKKQTSK